MTLFQLACFLGLVAAATYLQVLTGFAFALAIMGGAGLFGFPSLPDTAVIVGLLSLANAVQMLWKGHGAVLWKTLGIILLGTVLLLPVGYFILQHLSAENAAALSIALGIAIMICSLPLARPIEAMARLAPLATTFFFGAVSGLMTGLFSAGGPPLVYHLYRQPLSTVSVRETLILIFGLSQLVRVGLAGLDGGLNTGQFVIAGLALPVVIGVTWLGKRLPPPLGTGAMRKLVAALLFLSGLALMLPPLIAMLR